MVCINKQTGTLEGVPDIITRGFVMEDSEALLADGAKVLADVMDQASLEERTDQGEVRQRTAERRGGERGCGEDREKAEGHER